jgi:hypothetical protein
MVLFGFSVGFEKKMEIKYAARLLDFFDLGVTASCF